MFRENWISYLSEILPSSECEIRVEKELKIRVKEDLLLLIFFLKNHTYCGMKFLNDETCVDYLENKDRFQICFFLTSFYLKEKVMILSCVNEKKTLIYEHLSLTSYFSSSNWLEREIWDLFGIIFVGHNELRRILTDYGFEGYPLRKDFPVIGYLELRYNEKMKTLIYEPIELTQELREFQFQNPWKI